jgi:RNA polymerase sigma-70 factor (ECF subfamily)
MKRPRAALTLRLGTEQMPRPLHLCDMEIAALNYQADRLDEIVRRAARGDTVAFTEIVEEFHADVLRVCMVVTGNRSVAEDAAQEAWRKVWVHLGNLRSVERFRGWLLVVATNEARQQLRRRRAEPSMSSTDWLPASHSSVDPSVIDILADLSFDDRRLLGLRYAGGLTSEEIGAALGISAGAARHRLKRLIDRLREDMR